jgi:hypothetical protein
LALVLDLIDLTGDDLAGDDRTEVAGEVLAKLAGDAALAGEGILWRVVFSGRRTLVPDLDSRSAMSVAGEAAFSPGVDGGSFF